MMRFCPARGLQQIGFIFEKGSEESIQSLLSVQLCNGGVEQVVVGVIVEEADCGEGLRVNSPRSVEIHDSRVP